MSLTRYYGDGRSPRKTYEFLGVRHVLPVGPYPYWEQCGHLGPSERIGWVNSNKSVWAMSDIGVFIDSNGTPKEAVKMTKLGG